MSLVIWIIDDDMVSLYATRYRIVQSEIDAKVHDFDNAELALQVYLEKKHSDAEMPDIIFLDLIMPNMCGWQFLDELKNIPGEGKRPDVYVLSAFSNSKDRKRAEAHPAIRGHFDKPLSKIDMERMLLAVKDN